MYKTVIMSIMRSLQMICRGDNWKMKFMLLYG